MLLPTGNIIIGFFLQPFVTSRIAQKGKKTSLDFLHSGNIVDFILQMIVNRILKSRIFTLAFCRKRFSSAL